MNWKDQSRKTDEFTPFLHTQVESRSAVIGPSARRDLHLWRRSLTVDHMAFHCLFMCSYCFLLQFFSAFMSTMWDVTPDVSLASIRYYFNCQAVSWRIFPQTRSRFSVYQTGGDREGDTDRCDRFAFWECGGVAELWIVGTGTTFCIRSC